MKLWISITLFSIILATAITAVPLYLDQQGVLRNSTDAALINGSYNFNVTIYKLSDDSEVYTENRTLDVLSGVWNYEIGRLTSIDPTLFDDDLYFKTRVGDDQLSQVNFTTSPYAFRCYSSNDSDNLNGLGASSYTNSTQLSGVISGNMTVVNGWITSNVTVIKTWITGNASSQDGRHEINHTTLSNTTGTLTVNISYTDSIWARITNINNWISGNITLENTSMKSYVDSTFVELAGDTMTGDLKSESWFNGSFNISSLDSWITFNGYTIDFNESGLSTVYYNATQAHAIVGTVQGVLASTQHPDGNYDGITFNVTEEAGAPGLDVRMNFTNLSSFNQGIMRYKTTTLQGEYPVIQVWDYDSSDWDDYPPMSESLSYATIAQPVFDADDHISNEIVQMRIYKASNGNTGNKYIVDWVSVSKGYGTPAGEEVDPYWNEEKQYYYNRTKVDTRISNNYTALDVLMNTKINDNITKEVAWRDGNITFVNGTMKDYVDNAVSSGTRHNLNYTTLTNTTGLLTVNITYTDSLWTRITTVSDWMTQNNTLVKSWINNNATLLDTNFNTKLNNNMTVVTTWFTGNTTLYKSWINANYTALDVLMNTKINDNYTALDALINTKLNNNVTKIVAWRDNNITFVNGTMKTYVDSVAGKDGRHEINTTTLTNTTGTLTVNRSYIVALKVDNATFADTSHNATHCMDSTLLAGQAASTYLDNTNTRHEINETTITNTTGELTINITYIDLYWGRITDIGNWISGNVTAANTSMKGYVDANAAQDGRHEINQTTITNTTGIITVNRTWVVGVKVSNSTFSDNSHNATHSSTSTNSSFAKVSHNATHSSTATSSANATFAKTAHNATYASDAALLFGKGMSYFLTHLGFNANNITSGTIPQGVISQDWNTTVNGSSIHPTAVNVTENITLQVNVGAVCWANESDTCAGYITMNGSHLVLRRK